MKRILYVLLFTLLTTLSGVAVADNNATITITNPAAGVQWVRGNPYNITWWYGYSYDVTIELLGNGSTWSVTTTNTGSYHWNIPPGQTPGAYNIRITSTHNPASTVTSSTFYIVEYDPNKIITIYNPAVGVDWLQGVSHNITWWENVGGQVQIDLYDANDTYLHAITPLPISASLRTYAWNCSDVPIAPGDYKIRISWTTDPTNIYAESGTFRVVKYDPSSLITIYNPAAGVQWVTGTPHNITWWSNISHSSHVSIELLNTSGGTYTLTTSTLNNGTYSWIINGLGTTPVPVDDDYYVRITSVDGVTQGLSVTSEMTFSVVSYDPGSYLTITSPADGVKWLTDESHNLTWTGNCGASDQIQITLYDASTGLPVGSAATTTNTGTYSWDFTGVPAGSYYFLFEDLNRLTVTVSSSIFYVVDYDPSNVITIYNPAVGVQWIENTPHNITWWENVGGNVKIELVDPLTETVAATITSSVSASQRTFPWNCNFTPGDYKIKITRVDNSHIYGISGIFSIMEYNPASLITIYNPAAGVEWLENITYNITWWSNISHSENVDIFLNEVGGGTYTLTIGTSNDGTYSFGPIHLNYPGSVIPGYDPGPYTVTIQWSAHPEINVTSNVFYLVLDGKKSIGADVSGDLTLYPNPATDLLHVNSINTINRIMILNNLGQVMINREVNSNQAQLDVSTLSQGMYIVKIEENGTVNTRKLTIK